MPTRELDTRGKIAAGVIAFYTPITIFTFILFLRHGLKRDAGWMFLFIFSLIRVASGALLLAAELVETPMTALYTAAYALQSAALGFLMLSTVGFLGMIGKNAYSEPGYGRVTKIFKVFGLLTLAAIGLAVAAEVIANDPKQSANVGSSLRKASAVLYGALWVLLTITVFMCWSYRYQIMRYRRQFLTAVSLALLFMGVRVAYGIIDAWSNNVPTLARFNELTGIWWIFLIMFLIMELCVAIIYILGGTLIPMRKDRF